VAELRNLVVGLGDVFLMNVKRFIKERQQKMITCMHVFTLQVKELMQFKKLMPLKKINAHT